MYHTRYFLNCTCIEIQCLIKRSDDIYSTDCITANVEVYIYIVLNLSFEGDAIKLWYPLHDPPPLFFMNVLNIVKISGMNM